METGADWIFRCFHPSLFVCVFVRRVRNKLPEGSLQRKGQKMRNGFEKKV